MGRIETLAESYGRYISLPWRNDLAGAERVVFVVYDKADERRLRARLGLFEIETRNADHSWLTCDLTRAFGNWMAEIEYQKSYFESPEDLQFKLDNGFLQYAADAVREVLNSPDAGADAVVGVYGIASLYGLIRVSKLLKEIERDISGRLVVFFPGEFEYSNYRLLDARDGWNYLAVPITLGHGFGN